MTDKDGMKIRAKEKSKLSRAGLKAFFKLASLWKLSTEQQTILLGLEPSLNVNHLQNRVEAGEVVLLTENQLERLSLIIGIRKGVELLYPKERVDSVMHEPNKAFDGRTLIEIMLDGSVQSLYRVRQYLESSQGSHFV